MTRPSVSSVSTVIIAVVGYNSLNRCDLSLSLAAGVKGSYVVNRGCWVREGDDRHGALLGQRSDHRHRVRDRSSGARREPGHDAVV